jgi:hypothetical protein
VPDRELGTSLDTDCGDCGTLLLFVDLTEAASDLSSPNPEVDPRGLSLDLSRLPGILDRIEPFMDLMDSFVSDRENDG